MMTDVIRECPMCGSEQAAPGDPDGLRAGLCEDCCTVLEIRFTRPARAEGRRTLGDAVSESFGRFLDALLEVPDPDVLDIFPDLPEAARPARARMKRRLPTLANALRRVGWPVCLAVPDRAEDQLGDGLFLLAYLTDNGKAGYHQADWRLVFETPNCVNAHDYAPDGMLLANLVN